MKPLRRFFFNQPAAELAPALLGKILVHRIGKTQRRARIVETEAYVGPHDLACHTSKGRTARTEVMFGPPGHAYVYFIYGMYHMLNIVAGEPGSAVLIRAAEPLDGWATNLSGPGRLARGLGITRADNGVDLTGERMFLLSGSGDSPRIVYGKRIGVDYAGHWKDELLRFADADSKMVSRPRPALPSMAAFRAQLRGKLRGEATIEALRREQRY
jgi:DNA-3-methyladenine glycosylase